MSEHFFAPCPRGLEQSLAQELSSYNAGAITVTDGGVAFSGDWELVYHANLESRIASRILWRVGFTRYHNEEDIYKAALALPWPQWFDVANTIRVNLTAIRSPLTSLDFTTLRIKDAVCDRFREQTGQRPSVDTQMPDVRIHAFLTADTATLYLDTSGEALFKRGYRQSKGEAPLRENLAAGVLRLAGWQPGTPLYDPMCGSGTFLIEAAMMALNIAPGLNRNFGFEKLKNFNRAEWNRIRATAQARVEKTPASLAIYGSDLYGDALKTARENIHNAGLEHVITLKQVNVLDSAPFANEAGVIVSNPPYGVRMEELDELTTFYPKLGDALKQRYAGWTAYFLTADLRMAKLIGLKPSKRTPLYNGALECRLFEFKLVSGQNRKKQTENRP